METEVEQLFDDFTSAADGHEVHIVLTAVSAFLAEIISMYANHDEEEIRKLYDMMASAAIVLSQADMYESHTKLQAAKNSTKEEEAELARKTSWHVAGSSRTH